VDVSHAHHHARHTSSNPTWVAAQAPKDGRSRNVVAGINSGYIRSPYADVMANWADGDRLGAGFFWVTQVAALSGSHARLKNAEGKVIVQTIQGGRGYRVQAAGAKLFSVAYPSVRAGP